MEIKKKNIVKSLLLSSLALGLFVTANNNTVNASSGSNVTSEKVTNTKKTITIQTGDTVSAYAVKYNSTVKDIADLNKLANANLIYAGNKITIPLNSRAAGQSIYDGWNTSVQGAGVVQAQPVATAKTAPVTVTPAPAAQVSNAQTPVVPAAEAPAASVAASQAPASQTPASQTPASQTPTAFVPTEAGVRAALQAKVASFGLPSVHKIEFDGTTTGTLSGEVDGDVAAVTSNQQIADMMWDNSNASLIKNSINQFIGLNLQDVTVTVENGQVHATFTVAYQEK